MPTKKEKNPQPNAVQQKGGVSFSDWSVNVSSERSCSHAVGDGCPWFHLIDICISHELGEGSNFASPHHAVPPAPIPGPGAE